MKRAAQDDVCGGCGGIFKLMSKHHAARPRCLKMTVYKDDAGGEKEATMLDASEVEDITFQANIKATVLRDLSDFDLGATHRACMALPSTASKIASHPGSHYVMRVWLLRFDRTSAHPRVLMLRS